MCILVLFVGFHAHRNVVSKTLTGKKMCHFKNTRMKKMDYMARIFFPVNVRSDIRKKTFRICIFFMLDALPKATLRRLGTT